MALGWFTDSALTSSVSGNLIAKQYSDGSTGQVQFQVFLGDPDTGYQYQADSDPGTDQISIAITDSNPGTGHEATEVKLAVSQSALASATAGASLDIGITLTSGASNAQEVWIGVTDATSTIGTDITLSVAPNTLQKQSA